MEKNAPNLLAGFGNSFQTMAETYVNTMKSVMQNLSAAGTATGPVTSKAAVMPGSPSGKKESTCCPPKNECPPHCLLQITRQAYTDERIIVPFGVRNACKGQKRYRVGVRELKNINGNSAPSQPQLNKQDLTLEMGETEMVLMMIELKGFEAGTYNTEIVLRENEINQNICFTLQVNNYDNLPVAEPLEEIKYRLHWQDWSRHYYCETPRKAASIVRGNQQQPS